MFENMFIDDNRTKFLNNVNIINSKTGTIFNRKRLQYPIAEVGSFCGSFS